MQSSSELYFTQIVLKEKDDISDGIGLPNWELALTLLASWIIAFLVIIRGIKSLGKAAYFLALFPYVVLIILLVRAVTLDGSVDGIVFFFKPDWGELLNMKVWKEAVVQCFFSLSVSFGPIVSFSSYNPFSHNVYRDAMIVTTMDTFTSLLGGVTIFAILGNLAHNLNSEIDDVVLSGTGLAFISYPDAIAKFDVVPQLFAVLFFFMLFVLGVGSLVALESCLVTILCDQLKLKRFWAVALAISILGYGIGLVYVTPGGQWILNLVDYYAGTYVVFFLAIFEITGVMWIYGLQNFCDDVEFMLNRKVSFYWRVCWGIITPIMLAGIFIYSMVIATPLKYAGSRYPESADIAGWVILAVGCAQFPIWAIWYFAAHPDETFVKTIRKGTKPTSKWGPSSSISKADWIAFKQQRKEQRAKERESKNMNIFSQKLRYIFGCSK